MITNALTSLHAFSLLSVISWFLYKSKPHSRLSIFFTGSIPRMSKVVVAYCIRYTALIVSFSQTITFGIISLPILAVTLLYIWCRFLSFWILKTIRSSFRKLVGLTKKISTRFHRGLKSLYDDNMHLLRVICWWIPPIRNSLARLNARDLQDPWCRSFRCTF